MSKPFNKMTKAELEKAAKALKLEDKVTSIAKDAKAPTNAEYVTVLEEYKAEQDKVNATTKKELDAKPKEVKTKTVGKPATLEDKIAFNNTSFRVIITDHDNSTFIDDDDPKRLFQFSTGNSVVGGRTHRVLVDGTPQYVEMAAINRLKSITMTQHSKKQDGTPYVKTIERFKVTMVDGMTPDELEALRRNQVTRLNA